MIYSTIIETEVLKRIRVHAKNAWIHGKSNFRGKDREAFGMTDQLVGQLGEYSLSRLFGRENEYFERREEIDKNPRVGDGGSDLIGSQIDIKTSLMRRIKDPFSYNLVVRPRERHQDNIYILALTRPENESYWVGLIGAAYDTMFPDRPASTGVFSGAFTIPAKKLLDVKEICESFISS